MQKFYFDHVHGYHPTPTPSLKHRFKGRRVLSEWCVAPSRATEPMLMAVALIPHGSTLCSSECGAVAGMLLTSCSGGSGGCWCRYEIAKGDPLIHQDSNTHIHLHSVNQFHAASVDCTRSIMQLLRPSLLAVALPNDHQADIIGRAEARLRSVRSSEHLQRIADGYHRICMGALSVSLRLFQSTATHERCRRGQPTCECRVAIRPREYSALMI